LNEKETTTTFILPSVFIIGVTYPTPRLQRFHPTCHTRQ
jgi:hypothetical protein